MENFLFCAVYRTFNSHNVTNIFFVSHILLLFHSTKGLRNKSAKYKNFRDIILGTVQ